MKIFPSLSEFNDLRAQNKPQLVWAKFSSDLLTPVSLMLKFEGEKFCTLFESVEGGRNRGRYSAIAMRPDVLWRCENGVPQINDDLPFAGSSFKNDDETDVFASLRTFVNQAKLPISEELPPISAGVFGYLTYDMVRYMEKLPDDNQEIINVPESIFMRPQIVIIFDSVKDELIIVRSVRNYGDNSESDYEDTISSINDVLHKINSQPADLLAVKTESKNDIELEFSSNMTQAEYHEMVAKAKEYILAGDIFQVVPSQRFVAKFDKKAIDLYRSLRRMNPSPYSFMMTMDGFSLVGSSPEILVRMRAGKAVVRPIAGTRKRGKNKAEDQALAADLLSDEKELAEHLMLIDLGRNDIGRVAKIGTVDVTEKMVIENYSHVMHIVSNVEGEIRDDVDAIDALIAGFPVGTVSGAPKIRAMEIIDEMESERRSFYAGGVGYFSADGSVDICIALRTGLLKSGKLYVQAGGGVVADSDPEAEYQESCNKAGALMDAARQAVNDTTNR